jgi:CheY-like chemotaxis protein
MTTTPDKLIQILLVEDSPADILLTQEAFRRHKVINPLNVVENGVDAMAYLRREGAYANAKRPGLILLDLNLPRKSGREVLAEIKSDSSLRSIPVVILTTSEAEEDVIKSYGLYANCYITKPVEFKKLSEVIRALNEFWFCVVRLPLLPEQEL